MATVTTAHKGIDITESTPERLELVRRAQEADIAEHGLTIRQALKRYKKAVAWAFALSVCLVMDGYDVSYLALESGSDIGRRHYLILWSNPVPTTIWYTRWKRRIRHFSCVAIGSIQLFSRRSAVWSHGQWMAM